MDEPTLEVVWTQRALSDLSRIRAYIAVHAPIAAGRLSARLVAATAWTAIPCVDGNCGMGFGSSSL